MDAAILAAAIAIAAIGGIVRGITGFGGAMVMSPPLALLVGPRLTVPVVLLLEAIVALPMLVQTRRLVHWRVVGAIIVAAAVTIPLGTLILVRADPTAIRRAIAATVALFCVALLAGWRYRGRPRFATSAGVGALAGTMLGATSVGGPPVILYLLSGPDPIENTRANLTLYVTATSIVGVASLAMQGAIDATAPWTSLWLAPAYYAGLAGGGRVFPFLDEARFRRIALVVMIAVSAVILVA